MTQFSIKQIKKKKNKIKWNEIKIIKIQDRNINGIIWQIDRILSSWEICHRLDYFNLNSIQFFYLFNLSLQTERKVSWSIQVNQRFKIMTALNFTINSIIEIQLKITIWTWTKGNTY
jgi:hypothetical protein